VIRRVLARVFLHRPGNSLSELLPEPFVFCH
jgi:hypothetical protein